MSCRDRRVRRENRLGPNGLEILRRLEVAARDFAQQAQGQ
jgi:hypothetical protein